MQTHQLIELAAWTATNGAALIRTPAELSASGLQQFWTASRCRMDRWGRALNDLAAGMPDDPNATQQSVSAQVALVIEEILASEAFSRVSAAVLVSHDHQRDSGEYEPLARNLLLAQADIRQKALKMLIHSPLLDAQQAVELNRLRRKCDRWTDLFIGKLLLTDKVREFAVDLERAKEFAEGLLIKGSEQETHAWSILLGSMRAAFQHCLSPHAPNADLNERIATGWLSCFPSELFDGRGLVPTLWLTRMSHTTSDAQAMIDEMLANEYGPTHENAHPRFRAQTLPAKRPRRFDSGQSG